MEISDFQIILFGLLVFIDAVLFHWAGFTLVLARGETKRMEKARRLLTIAFLLLFTILLLVFIFYLANYLFKEKEIPPAPEESSEFPPPWHLSPFPPAPELIQIGRYYFKGPLFLQINHSIEEPVIYAILCKRNEEYDTIYIEKTTGIKLLEHSQYKCWLENCDEKFTNLYLAFFPTPEGYDIEKIKKIETNLKDQANSPCFESEATEPPKL